MDDFVKLIVRTRLWSEAKVEKAESGLITAFIRMITAAVENNGKIIKIFKFVNKYDSYYLYPSITYLI